MSEDLGIALAPRANTQPAAANGHAAAANDGRGSSFTGLSRGHRWALSLVETDPRRMILDFFAAGDERGPLGLLRSRGDELPPPSSPATPASLAASAAFSMAILEARRRTGSCCMCLQWKSSSR